MQHLQQAWKKNSHLVETLSFEPVLALGFQSVFCNWRRISTPIAPISTTNFCRVGIAYQNQLIFVEWASPTKTNISVSDNGGQCPLPPTRIVQYLSQNWLQSLLSHLLDDFSYFQNLFGGRARAQTSQRHNTPRIRHTTKHKNLSFPCPMPIAPDPPNAQIHNISFHLGRGVTSEVK
ncbi:MAG: hypothetical protein ACHBN1_08355 [Heteroscytonema crispum UTEX LB 1556]